MLGIANEYKQRSIAFMNTLTEDSTMQWIIFIIFTMLIATVIACSLWVYYQSKNNQDNNINTNNMNNNMNNNNLVQKTKPIKSTPNKPVVQPSSLLSSSSESSATLPITLKDNNQTKQSSLQQQQKQTSVPIQNTNNQHNTSNPNNNITIKEPIPQLWNFTPNRNESNYKSGYTSFTQQMPNNNNNLFSSGQIVQIGDTQTITKQRTIETTITYENKPLTIKQTITDKFAIPTNLLVSALVQEIRYAVVEDQGKRKYMENSTNIFDMDGDEKSSTHVRKAFSVWDGHLGDQAAKFCTEYLPKRAKKLIDQVNDITSCNIINNDCNDDDMIWRNQNDDEDGIASAIRKAFHETDEEFKKYAFDNQCEAGAVGVYAYYDYDSESSNTDYIYVANVGDCRAILCSEGKVKVLTEDHNPKNESEKERCGIKGNSDLLCGQISVTRAIGDYYKLKNDTDKQVEGKSNNNNNGYQHEKLEGLSCDPHIIRHKLDKKDEFLIIACDGLWDVVTNEQAKSECRRQLREHGDCKKAAQRLVEFAKRISCRTNLCFNDDEPKLTSDNISVMVIGFANKSDKDGKYHIGPPKPKMGGSRLGGSRLRFRRKLGGK